MDPVRRTVLGVAANAAAKALNALEDLGHLMPEGMGEPIMEWLRYEMPGLDWTQGERTDLFEAGGRRGRLFIDVDLSQGGRCMIWVDTEPVQENVRNLVASGFGLTVVAAVMMAWGDLEHSAKFVPIAYPLFRASLPAE